VFAVLQQLKDLLLESLQPEESVDEPNVRSFTDACGAHAALPLMNANAKPGTFHFHHFYWRFIFPIQDPSLLTCLVGVLGIAFILLEII